MNDFSGGFRGVMSFECDGPGPMAMFREGGTGASVKHIDPSDNRGAGSSIGAALQDLPDGTKILIQIVK